MGTTLHPHDGRSHLDRFGPAALATTGVGVAAVAAKAASIGVPCPLLATTGVPCPACGMTRLADAVAHGRVVEAVTIDPAGVLFLLVIAGLAAAFLLSRARGLPRRLPNVRAAPVVLGALLAAHWATTLVTGGYVHP